MSRSNANPQQQGSVLRGRAGAEVTGGRLSPQRVGVGHASARGGLGELGMEGRGEEEVGGV